jgi:hypothetical protein
MGGGGSTSAGGGMINDLLGGLFGGGDQDDSGRRASGASAGQAGSLNDLLDSPIAKAILAAIAAMAMKKFMGGGLSLPGLGGSDEPERARDDGGAFGRSDAPRRSGGLKGAQGKEA